MGSRIWTEMDVSNSNLTSLGCQLLGETLLPLNYWFLVDFKTLVYLFKVSPSLLFVSYKHELNIVKLINQKCYMVVMVRWWLVFVPLIHSGLVQPSIRQYNDILTIFSQLILISITQLLIFNLLLSNTHKLVLLWGYMLGMLSIKLVI